MVLEQNVPANAEEHGLVLDTTHDLHQDHVDPQLQVVRQNIRVALLPLAILAFTPWPAGEAPPQDGAPT